MKVVYHPKHVSVVSNSKTSKKLLLKRDNISNIIENSHEYSVSTEKLKSKRSSYTQNALKKKDPITVTPYSHDIDKDSSITSEYDKSPHPSNSSVVDKKDHKKLLLTSQEAFHTGIIPNNKITKINTTSTSRPLNYATIPTNEKSTKGSNVNLPYEVIETFNGKIPLTLNTNLPTGNENNINNILSPTGSTSNFNACNLTISSNNRLFSASSSSSKCIICSRVYPSNGMLTTLTCEHKFCIYCIGNYFEYKICNSELNDFTNIKCPVITCPSSVAFDEIEKVLPQVVLDYINKGNNGPMKYSIEDITNIKIHRKDELLTSYSQRNVLDVNTNENFYLFSKIKDKSCPDCHGEFLFARKGLNNYVCLNCLKHFCKFCKKEYSEKHLDKSYKDRCKIYFKIEGEEYFNQLNNKKKHNLCVDYLIFVAYIVISFFLILFGVCFYIRDGIKKCFKIKHRNSFFSLIKLIAFYILYCISLAIVIPILLMSFPYFPLIVSI